MVSDKAPRLFQLYKTFFLIGAFTLGGGVAMIPMMEKELVEENDWISSCDFLDIVAIAQSAPGAMAVNTSIYTGYALRGLKGAIVSFLGTVMPSFLIMIAVAAVFTNFQSNPWVQAAFMGIRPAVVALLMSSVIKMAKSCKLEGIRIVVTIGVGILVGILGVSPIPLIIIGGTGYLTYRTIEEKRKSSKE